MPHSMSGQHLICKFSLQLAYSLRSLSSNGKQGPVPEEMYQTMLTNKKRRKKLLSTCRYTIKPTQFSIYRKKYVYFYVKSEEPLKSLNPNQDSYLGRDLSIHVNKSQIPYLSGDPVPLKGMYKGALFLSTNRRTFGDESYRM